MEDGADNIAVPATWSPSLQEAVKADELGVVDYELTLDYNYWNYCTLRRLPAAGRNSHRSQMM